MMNDESHNCCGLIVANPINTLYRFEMLIYIVELVLLTIKASPHAGSWVIVLVMNFHAKLWSCVNQIF